MKRRHLKFYQVFSVTSNIYGSREKLFNDTIRKTQYDRELLQNMNTQSPILQTTWVGPIPCQTHSMFICKDTSRIWQEKASQEPYFKPARNSEKNVTTGENAGFD